MNVCTFPVREAPKVSVIIPIYNRARELPACLDSVLSQSLREIEVICIDDGSPDWAWAVLECYQRKDGRVRACRQPNRGVSAARNRAMRLATGRYLTFMDPDDTYPHREALAALYAALVSTGLPIAKGATEIAGQNACAGVRVVRPLHGVGVHDATAVLDCYMFGSCLYDRAWLLGQGIVFPPLCYYEDPPFLARALLAAKRYVVVDAIVYHYSGAHDPDWRRDDWRPFRDYCLGLAEIERLVRRHKLTLRQEGARATFAHAEWNQNFVALRDVVFGFPEFNALLEACPEADAAAIKARVGRILPPKRKSARRRALRALRRALRDCLPYGLVKRWLRKRHGFDLP